MYTIWKYHPSSGISQPKSNTKGNKYKLLNHTFHYDTRKYSFSVRVVNIWSSLPNSVVVVCLFKAHLDKFWITKVLYTTLQPI